MLILKYIDLYFLFLENRSAEETNFWIGAQKHRDGTWVWNDGTYMEYTNWMSQQPNASITNHTTINSNIKACPYTKKLYYSESHEGRYKRALKGGNNSILGNRVKKTKYIRNKSTTTTTTMASPSEEEGYAYENSYDSYEGYDNNYESSNDYDDSNSYSGPHKGAGGMGGFMGGMGGFPGIKKSEIFSYDFLTILKCRFRIVRKSM